MRTIGIRELKARLSQVIRDVGTGDVFLVTDRGRVVAELRRPDAAQWVAAPTQRALARLASDGKLRIAEGPATRYRLSPVRAATGLSRQLIDEDRGE